MKQSTRASKIDTASCALVAAVAAATGAVVSRRTAPHVDLCRPYGVDLAAVCGLFPERSNASLVFVSYKPSTITARR